MSNEIEKNEVAIDTTGYSTKELSIGRNLDNEGRIYKMLTAKATMYANSDIVPEQYKGKPANCYVALELSYRMGAPEMLVMQNLYIVKGKPSWSGQACIALINGSGRYTDTDFIEVGTRNQKDWGYYFKATRKRDGKVIKGTTVDMALAHAEGWFSKTGSKWQTMPEQMLKYRCAAFFARVECPDVLMGVSVEGEIEDVFGQEQSQIETVKITRGVK